MRSLRARPAGRSSTAIGPGVLIAAYEDDAGFGSGHASAVFALTGVCITAGGVLLGRWSDSVGRRAAMTWTYLGMTVAILLVPVGAEPWAGFSALVFGLALSGAPTVLAAHLADRLDPRGFAAAFGAVTLVFGLAQLVGPQLAGWLADRTGSFSTAFLVAAAAALGAALASATLPQRGAAVRSRVIAPDASCPAPDIPVAAGPPSADVATWSNHTPVRSNARRPRRRRRVTVAPVPAAGPSVSACESRGAVADRCSPG